MSRLKLFAVVFALGAAGCHSTTTPTTPTATPITDTFLGTLTVNGGVTHQFAAARSGTIQETLTALSPDSTVILGISLGTWNGNTCQVVLAKDNAGAGKEVMDRSRERHATEYGAARCLRPFEGTVRLWQGHEHSRHRSRRH